MANISAAERRRRRRKKQAESASAISPSPRASASNRRLSETDQATDLNIASPLKRLYAFGIDIGILYSVILFTKRIFGDAVWTPETATPDVFIILGYFVIPTAIFGRTAGKWVAGMRVVDVQGRRLFPATAIPREVAGRLVATITVLGIAWCVFDPKRQGWHDKIAGTLVVNTPDSGGTGFMRRWFRVEDSAKKK